MKQINKVSIALKPNVYSTFRNLNNTVSNTLGEYVDNAVQSFLNHKTELFDLESNYKLRIEISVDWENRTILISDNAAGIDAVNYQRAFEPAHIPLDDTGLNEFGMGMKTASVWLANKWCVYTKALGEDVERFTEFDLQKVTTEEKEELVVIEKNAPANEHYTDDNRDRYLVRGNKLYPIMKDGINELPLVKISKKQAKIELQDYPFYYNVKD